MPITPNTSSFVLVRWPIDYCLRMLRICEGKLFLSIDHCYISVFLWTMGAISPLHKSRLWLPDMIDHVEESARIYTEGDLQNGVQVLRVSLKLFESLHQKNGAKTCHPSMDHRPMGHRRKVMTPVWGNSSTTFKAFTDLFMILNMIQFQTCIPLTNIYALLFV